MNYAKAIKTLRASRNLQQKQLAALLGVDASYISLLERGSRTPSLDWIERFSAAVRVPVYLVLLLASDDSDLNGVNAAEAQQLGKELLRALTSVESGR